MIQIPLKFDYSRMKNKSHYYFFRDCLEVIGEEMAASIGLTTYRDEFARLLQVEHDSWYRARDKAYDHGKDYLRLKGECRSVEVYITQLVRYARHIPHAAKAEAAERLWRIVEEWRGRTARNKRGWKTHADMMVRLMLEKRPEDVATLGIEPELRLYEQKSDEMENASKGKADERYFRAHTPPTKVIRPQVDAAARTYFSAINAIYQVMVYTHFAPEKRDEVEQVVKRISGLVGELKRELPRRKGRKEDEQETEIDNDHTTNNL